LLAYSRWDEFLLVVAWRDLASLVAINNQPSSSSLLAIRRTKVCSLLLSHNQQRLLLSSFDGQHEKFDCCVVLTSRDGRTTAVAPRQYDCFPQHQKMLCPLVFTMRDMLYHAITQKIRPSPSLLTIRRVKYTLRHRFSRK
jgi:hypothetical protein